MWSTNGFYWELEDNLIALLTISLRHTCHLFRFEHCLEDLDIAFFLVFLLLIPNPSLLINLFLAYSTDEILQMQHKWVRWG